MRVTDSSVDRAQHLGITEFTFLRFSGLQTKLCFLLQWSFMYHIKKNFFVLREHRDGKTEKKKIIKE